GRIIGGHEVKPHSRPYMAYLSITSESKTSQCGGFLVSPHAVLSAAHCVAGEMEVTINVTLGAHNRDKKEPEQQVRQVDHWVIHSKYSNGENDIMLLKLKPRVKLNRAVKTIPFARRTDYVKPGTTCQAAGWGKTSLNGGSNHVLREVNLKVQREEVCEEAFDEYLQQSMLCAGDKNGKRGDSGGPLVCKRKVHGIVSHGSEDSLSSTVFTRVSYFEPWIHKELKK
ncbi:MCT1A protease, partial [Psilopogon haemacephalus]|nr:MCT1A protease [Psilopogon haemacephalus]